MASVFCDLDTTWHAPILATNPERVRPDIDGDVVTQPPHLRHGQFNRVSVIDDTNHDEYRRSSPCSIWPQRPSPPPSSHR